MLEIQDIDEVYSRVLKKVIYQGKCWVYTGNSTATYPTIKVQKTTRGVHIISYLYHKGDYPLGYQIDHACKNKRCVNPDHLEAVTPETNSRRSKGWTEKNGKWYCKRGHLLEGFNLRKAPNGHWSCRECMNLSVYRYQAGQSKTKSASKNSLFKY